MATAWVWVPVGLASAPAGAAASSTPITIGAVATMSTSQGVDLDPQNTLTAWARYVNSHGGIDGHQVKVIVKDDHNDPGTSVAAAQSLIQDHVVAIIDDSLNDTGWAAAATAAHIPVLCGVQSGDGFICQSNPNFFPSGTTVLPGLYGNAVAAKLSGAKSFAVVYCTEEPECAQAVPVYKPLVKENGMKYLPALAASETAISYTAQCVELKSEGAQAVFPAGPPSLKMASDCAQQGYNPKYVQAMGTWQNNFLTSKNLNGTVGVTADIPWFLHTPATKALQSAMGARLGKVTSSTTNTVVDYFIQGTWAAAQLFDYALTAAHPTGTPTSQDVYDGLYSLHGTTLGGFSPPLTFTQGKPTTVSCFFLVSVKNGQFVATHGSKYQCQPSS